MGQVELALFVTATPQRLVALTLEVLVASPLAGAVKLPVNVAETPGASEATVKTGVLPLRSLVTTRLFKVMLPALRMLPL